VLEPPPGPYYFDSIRLGGRDALALDVPILSGAEKLTVAYKFGGGAVRGAIDGCRGDRVLLLPVDTALRRHEFLRETRCGANGQFEFSAVRPGEYYGIAIVNGSSQQWYTALWDDAQLNQRAGRVTVRANENTTAVIRLTAW